MLTAPPADLSLKRLMWFCMQAAGLEAAPELTRGAVFLVPAGTALQLQSVAADGPMLVRLHTDMALCAQRRPEGRVPQWHML